MRTFMDLCYRFACGDGIIASTRKRIAAQEPPQAQRCSAEQAVAGHGFCRVFRARRNVAAGGRQPWRDHALVRPQQTCCNRNFHLPLPRCTAAKTCPISASSCANFMVKTLFRGCKTKSRGFTSSAICRLTAARMRLRIRLRSTAPPRTFPTVKPTRAPPARRFS